jgi:hypothetical protein
MPRVFGRDARTVEELVDVFRSFGPAVRGTYRAHYAWRRRSDHPYVAARLERPPALRGNPEEVLFPWEQIFTAAATCTGSDYPMLAAHLGVSLDEVALVVEAVFDPRGEFHGLAGFEAPADAAPCYLSLHVRATLTSAAPREVLQKIHAHVVGRNMVLGALRGIPRTDELVVSHVRENVTQP